MAGNQKNGFVIEALLPPAEAGELRPGFRMTIGSSTVPIWAPAVDMYESDNEIHVRIALPGLKSGQVEISIDATGILVRGLQPLHTRATPCLIHRIEIPYGYFERRIELPQDHFTLLDQYYEDGCQILVLRRLCGEADHGIEK